MKRYNDEKYIISFTSFGKRFNSAAKMIFSLLQQSYKNFHIVMTVFEGDVKDLTSELKLLIDNDIIEMLVVKENLCPHLKYFYAMQKYKDKPIITVDDDRIYTSNTIKLLVDKFEALNYKSVVSICAPKMTKTGNLVDNDSRWCIIKNRLKPNEKSFIAMAEGFAGVLYPPNAFDNLENKINDIKECLYHDDLFLKVLEIENNIPVTNVNGTFGKECDALEQNMISSSLKNNHNLSNNYRNIVTKMYNEKLIRGFSLK